MKKIASHKIFTAFFLTIIYLPALGLLLPAFYSEGSHENRKLKDFPVFYWKDYTKYPREFSNFLSDQFPFRNQFIFAYYWIKLRVWRDNLFPIAVMGKDGWLYYRPISRGPVSESMPLSDGRLTSTEMEQLKNGLEELQNKFKKNNTFFLMVVVPDKSTVYPEYLPSSFKPATTGPGSRSEQLTLYLKDSALSWIDIRKRLFQGKKEHPVGSKTDSHWNEFGAFLGYQAIMDWVRELHPDILSLQIEDFDLQQSSGPADGDLSNVSFLRGALKEEKIHLKRREGTSAKPLPNRYRFVLYGDSSKDNISPFFEQTFLNFSQGQTETLMRHEIPDQPADFSVLLVVERSLHSLFQEKTKESHGI